MLEINHEQAKEVLDTVYKYFLTYQWWIIITLDESGEFETTRLKKEFYKDRDDCVHEFEIDSSDEDSIFLKIFLFKKIFMLPEELAESLYDSAYRANSPYNIPLPSKEMLFYRQMFAISISPEHGFSITQWFNQELSARGFIE